MADPPNVTFVERSGAGADVALRRLSARLESERVPSRLLRSREPDGPWLLVVHGDPTLSDEERADARVWRFEEPPA